MILKSLINKIENSFMFSIHLSFSLGYDCPYNYNPADFIIKTLAIEPSNRQTSLDRINVYESTFYTINTNLQLSFFIPISRKSATDLRKAFS